jgi:hypothetical protein
VSRPADDGGPTPADLKVEVETLTTFKNRIDEMLKDLDSSEASPKKIGQDRLKPDHLGNGFGESSKLMSTYNHVHDRLETLSKLLADQIEVMSLAVGVSHKELGDVDEEQRRKMWAIYDTTDKYYDPKLDPNAPKTPGATPPKQSSVGGMG